MPEGTRLVSWRDVAIAAISVVATLLGAWATHSISKEDMNTSQTQQNVVYTLSLEVIKTRLDVVVENQNNVIKELRALQTQVDKGGK